MIDTKTTSIVDLIFDKRFKDWLKKGQPNSSEFSTLTAATLQEALERITLFESQKIHFSKSEINNKYADVMRRIKG
jgi:hypothetical protein